MALSELETYFKASSQLFCAVRQQPSARGACCEVARAAGYIIPAAGWQLLSACDIATECRLPHFVNHVSHVLPQEGNLPPGMVSKNNTDGDDAGGHLRLMRPGLLAMHHVMVWFDPPCRRCLTLACVVLVALVVSSHSCCVQWGTVFGC